MHMAWDDTKTPSDSLTASEYNAMVTDQKSRITRSEFDTALEKMKTAIANADVDGGSA